MKQLYKSGRPKEYNINRENNPEIPSVKGEYRIIDKWRRVEYVGYTNNLNRRMKEHKRSGKLGGDNCIFAYKVADGRASRDRLAAHETAKIKKHDPALNKRAGGAGRPFKRTKKQSADQIVAI
jgi:excinuclease UvrABC nuclease subunit